MGEKVMFCTIVLHSTTAVDIGITFIYIIIKKVSEYLPE